MSTSDNNINMTEEEYAEIELLRKAIDEKKKAPKNPKKPPKKRVSRSEGDAPAHESEVIRPSRAKKGGRKKTSNAPVIVMIVVLLIAVGGGIGYYSMNQNQTDTIKTLQKQGKQKDKVSGLEGGVRVGVVVTVRGDMQVNNTGEFIKAAANMTNILESAVVKTGADSFGCVAVSGALVYLDAGTSISMGKDKMSGPSGAALTVSSGRIYVQAEGTAGYDQFRVSSGGKTIYGAGSEYIVYAGGTVGAARGSAFIKAGGSESTVPEMKTSTGGDIADADHSWMHAQGTKYALSSKLKGKDGKSSSGISGVPSSGSSSTGTATRSTGSNPAGFMYSEKFSDTQLSNWQIVGGGSWLVQRGAQINHSSEEARGILLLKGKSAKYFSMKATMKTGSSGSIGFVFGYSGGSFYMLRWKARGDFELVKVTGGSEEIMHTEDYRSPDRNKDMNLELLIDTTTIRVFLENKMVFRYSAKGAYTGNVGLLAESNPDAVFSGISVDAREQEKPRF